MRLSSKAIAVKANWTLPKNGCSVRRPSCCELFCFDVSTTPSLLIFRFVATCNTEIRRPLALPKLAFWQTLQTQGLWQQPRPDLLQHSQMLDDSTIHKGHWMRSGRSGRSARFMTSFRVSLTLQHPISKLSQLCNIAH